MTDNRTTENHPCDMGIDFHAGECPDYDSTDCPKTTPGAECGVDMQYAQELIESKYRLLRERGIDSQEIADELNAVMNGGECEMKPVPFMGFKCSECGKASYMFGENGMETPRFCPNCGKKVKR